MQDPLSLEGLPRMPTPPELSLDVRGFEVLSPKQKAEIRDGLEAWRDILRENPMSAYGPAGAKHHAFHWAGRRPGGRCVHRVRLFSGGNRAGKTTTATADNLIQMMPPELVPEHLALYKFWDCSVQPFQLRVVVPDLIRTGAVILEKWRELVPKRLLRKGSWDRSYDKSLNVLQLECGCLLELLSCEMDLNKFGGSARDRIQYDETPEEKRRNESKMRLTDRGGDEVFTATPLGGLDWTYRQIWKKRGLPEDGRVRVWAHAVGIRDNRFLSEENIAEALAEITNPAERRQRELGEYAELGGAIYPHLHHAVCEAPGADEVGLADEVVVAIDPGARFCGIVFTDWDRNNWCRVFASALLKNSDVAQVAKIVRRVLGAWHLKLGTTGERASVRIVVDPKSAAQRSLIDLDTYLAALAREGIYAEKAYNKVEEGIQEVQRRMRQGTLRISQALGGLLDELTEYSWELKDEDDGVARPKKINDHRCDALRYAVMTRPWEPEVRSAGEMTMDALDVATPPRLEDELRGSVAGAFV